MLFKMVCSDNKEPYLNFTQTNNMQTGKQGDDKTASPIKTNF